MTVLASRSERMLTHLGRESCLQSKACVARGSSTSSEEDSIRPSDLLSNQVQAAWPYLKSSNLTVNHPPISRSGYHFAPFPFPSNQSQPPTITYRLALPSSSLFCLFRL